MDEIDGFEKRRAPRIVITPQHEVVVKTENPMLGPLSLINISSIGLGIAKTTEADPLRVGHDYSAKIAMGEVTFKIGFTVQATTSFRHGCEITRSERGFRTFFSKFFRDELGALTLREENDVTKPNELNYVSEGVGFLKINTDKEKIIEAVISAGEITAKYSVEKGFLGPSKTWNLKPTDSEKSFILKFVSNAITVPSDMRKCLLELYS